MEIWTWLYLVEVEYPARYKLPRAPAEPLLPGA